MPFFSPRIGPWLGIPTPGSLQCAVWRAWGVGGLAVVMVHDDWIGMLGVFPRRLGKLQIN